ncbi:MAG: hypothetical protein ABI528_04340 [bacterium]
MNKKKILILSITNQDSAPRVIRQIGFLGNKYELYCCGLKNSTIPKNFFFPLIKSRALSISNAIITLFKIFRLFRLAEIMIVKYKFRIDGHDKFPEFDLVIAHDLDAVAIAYGKFDAKKVFVDLHEYAPEEFGETFYWKLINRNFILYQCRKYFSMVDASCTVCQSISDEYKKIFSTAPVVITNATGFVDLKPSVPGKRIRIISHGSAIRSRKIELMIEIAKLLDDRFSMDLMLIPNDIAYYNSLKEIAEVSCNVRIISPVDFKDIIYYCNQYDIGLYMIFPTNLNNKFSLPNKFFEFIQSRLAIITGPSDEMKNYIDKYHLGFASKNFKPEDVAKEINKLTNKQIEEYKVSTDSHARELSSDKNKTIFNNIVDKLIKN